MSIYVIFFLALSRLFDMRIFVKFRVARKKNFVVMNKLFDFATRSSHSGQAKVEVACWIKHFSVTQVSWWSCMIYILNRIDHCELTTCDVVSFLLVTRVVYFLPLAEERVQWKVLVNTVLNLRVTKIENFAQVNDFQLFTEDSLSPLLFQCLYSAFTRDLLFYKKKKKTECWTFSPKHWL
jgi:hypothetical protein